MTPELLHYLCDPYSKKSLTLTDKEFDSRGKIISGKLTSPDGTTFPIINGIPRFIHNTNLKKTVKSFGDEWNYFNFTEFKVHWLNHTVANTFGSTDVFKDKMILDAGGGSGAQTLWMLESGAKYVIMMELSDSVDDVVRRNLEPSDFTNYDVIQCSIDCPPIKEESINGIVICHNVIHHTPSVEKTAQALFALVAPGGEFVFNCYRWNEKGLFRLIRFYLIYKILRMMLSRSPFWVNLAYARGMGILRILPGIGWFLEKSGFCLQGDVPREGDLWHHIRHRYRVTVLNTFDRFGSHTFQHHKRNSELQTLVRSLQPDPTKVLNTDRFFAQKNLPGCALRVFK